MVKTLIYTLVALLVLACGSLIMIPRERLAARIVSLHACVLVNDVCHAGPVLNDTAPRDPHSIPWGDIFMVHGKTWMAKSVTWTAEWPECVRVAHCPVAYAGPFEVVTQRDEWLPMRVGGDQSVIVILRALRGNKVVADTIRFDPPGMSAHKSD